MGGLSTCPTLICDLETAHWCREIICPSSSPFLDPPLLVYTGYSIPVSFIVPWFSMKLERIGRGIMDGNSVYESS